MPVAAFQMRINRLPPGGKPFAVGGILQARNALVGFAAVMKQAGAEPGERAGGERVAVQVARALGRFHAQQGGGLLEFNSMRREVLFLRFLDGKLVLRGRLHFF